MPPKRPLTAFFHFATVRRGEIRDRNPEMPVTEIAKQCGSDWQSLSDAEKEPFEAKAAEDKARYDREMAEWDSNYSGSSGELRATQVSTQSSSGVESGGILDSRDSDEAIAA